MKRLFVACPVPDSVKKGLGDLQNDLRHAGFDRLRFVRPEGIHITLKFLGSVSVDRIASLSAAIAAVVEPFELRLTVEGLGGFGGGRMAGGVIWAGVRGEWEELGRLAERIERAAEQTGFPRESRPFRPHLTLARLPRDMLVERRRELRQYLERYTLRAFPPMIVTDVHLMESILGPDGSRYRQIASFPQKGSGAS